MDFFPRLAAGAVFAQDPGADTPSPIQTGSCAAFTSRDIFLTAAHCVDTDLDLYVGLEGEKRGRVVTRKFINDKVDLAMLECSPSEAGNQGFSDQYFLGLDDDIRDGADYICYGYPAEWVEGRSLPAGRTIRGNVQRIMVYKGFGERTYLAFELSAPAQPGLGGSGIAYTANPRFLAGVVTANVDSHVLIDRFEDVEKDGNLYREQISRVISYGIAAGVHSAKDWIAEQLAVVNN